jgi:predicted RNA-binding protein YlqC (UPF0109 family)
MSSAQLPGLVEYLAKGLVDKPDAVIVTEVDLADQLILELEVDPDDVGKVIGKQGRTVKAMRTLLSAAAAKIGDGATSRRRTVLEIVD